MALFFNSVSDRRCRICFAVSSATRNKGNESGNLHVRSRRQWLSEDFFTKPPYTRGARFSTTRQKRGNRNLLLNNLYWMVWLDRGLAPRDSAGTRGLLGGPRSLLVGTSGLCVELGLLCKEEQLERAMDVLVRMDSQSTVPSVEMYRTLLKLCTKMKALAQANQVHAHLARHGLQSTRYLGESVVKTLVNCGGLEDALEVFNTLLRRSVVSWTAVIHGFTTIGQGKEALRMYQLMQEEGVVPDTHTFASVARACGIMADLGKGKCIHAEALKYRERRAGCAGWAVHKIEITGNGEVNTCRRSEEGL